MSKNDPFTLVLKVASDIAAACNTAAPLEPATALFLSAWPQRLASLDTIANAISPHLQERCKHSTPIRILEFCVGRLKSFAVCMTKEDHGNLLVFRRALHLYYNPSPDPSPLSKAIETRLVSLIASARKAEAGTQKDDSKDIMSRSQYIALDSLLAMLHLQFCVQESAPDN